MSSIDRLCTALWVRIRRLHAEEIGQDLIEYGLLAALIAPVVVFLILQFGPQFDLYFQDVVNAFPAHGS
jgi:Flp pilus assembly pilin Flp